MQDVIILILGNLNIKEIIKCELICQDYKFIIRNHYWINKKIMLASINIDYVLNNYNFKNIKINSNIDVNMYINKLKHCHTLDLTCTNIMDESVKELKNCHTLNLSGTNITDESVKELKNCHTLHLGWTKITDESVKKLKNCHTLYLSDTNITDESVKELKNCHTLNLSGTNITDESVKELKKNYFI
jgi:Leucine-rich repeat (LRR) protein